LVLSPVIRYGPLVRFRAFYVTMIGFYA